MIISVLTSCGKRAIKIPEMLSGSWINSENITEKISFNRENVFYENCYYNVKTLKINASGCHEIILKKKIDFYDFKNEKDFFLGSFLGFIGNDSLHLKFLGDTVLISSDKKKFIKQQNYSTNSHSAQ